MSKNIKKLATSLDNKLIDLDLSTSGVVCLSGSQDRKNAILDILEMCLSGNLAYLSSHKGVSTLQYANGLSVYSSNSIDSIGDIPKFHCIRYEDGVGIRSNLNIDIDNISIFNSKTEYNKCIRSICLLNRLVGYDFITLDSNRKLVLDIHPFGDWSEEAIRFVYLLVIESMMTPEGYLRVVLLSEANLLSMKQGLELVIVLNSISRGELIVCSNTVPSDLYGLDCNVLNVNI